MWDELETMISNNLEDSSVTTQVTNIRGKDFQGHSGAAVHYVASTAQAIVASINPGQNAYGQGISINNNFVTQSAILENATVTLIEGVDQAQDGYVDEISLAWADRIDKIDALPELPKRQHDHGANRGPGATILSGANIGTIKGGGIYSRDLHKRRFVG